MSYVQGEDRGQAALLPAAIEDYVAADAPVRVIKAFVDGLDVIGLPNQERSILERLVSQRIDGCILCPALSRADNALFLKRHHVPSVILERSLGKKTPDHDFIGHDNFQSGYLATRKLLEAEHRRIVYLGWNSPIPNIHDRERGYRAALVEFGVEVRPEWVLLGALTYDGGRQLAEQLPFGEISAVVLGTHNEMAKGVLLYLQENDVRWPEDLSLVLIGTPEWSDLLRPSLACVKRPESEMGGAAASLLLEKLKNPTHRRTKQVLPTRFIEGAVHPAGKRKLTNMVSLMLAAVQRVL
jgi:LacI family transcriptional regulator, galactose operon repressor